MDIQKSTYPTLYRVNRRKKAFAVLLLAFFLITAITFNVLPRFSTLPHSFRYYAVAMWLIISGIFGIGSRFILRDAKQYAEELQRLSKEIEVISSPTTRIAAQVTSWQTKMYLQSKGLRGYTSAFPMIFGILAIIMGVLGFYWTLMYY